MAEPWELLFRRALAQLRQGGVAESDWVFGGGTVLKLKLNHRESKDIDIFFNNIQLLSRISTTWLRKRYKESSNIYY